jgi:hypothetical protein
MRTTLTLDDDVAAALERLRKTCNASLKDLVNEALRRGFKEMPTWPPWRSSTDKCSAPRTVTSRDFPNYVG